MKGFKALFVVAALSLTALAVSAGSALANTAANTLILNSAKLTFSGGTPVTASVGVTVSLVPAAANVTIIAGSTTAYINTNSPKISDTVTVTSNANGPADYDITPVLGTTTNATGTSLSAGGKVTIGATVTTSGSTVNYLVVPGQKGATSVNGITKGNNLVFTSTSGHICNLLNVTLTDQGDGTFWISWANGPLQSADVPGVGIQVSQVVTFNVDVLPGTIATFGSSIIQNVTATVTNDANPSLTATTQSAAVNTWTSTSANPTIAFAKYVRNATPNTTGNSNATGGTPLTVNSAQNTYYTAGVTGKPGDVLEYVIIATNNGTADLAGSAISDFVPVNFVNLVTSAYGGANSGKDIIYVDPTNTTSTLTLGSQGQAQASFVSANNVNPNLQVNVGNGATGSAGGIIPAGKSVTIAYQTVIR